jgi:hypothetical protein
VVPDGVAFLPLYRLPSPLGAPTVVFLAQ